MAKGLCEGCAAKKTATAEVQRSPRPWKKWYDSARWRAMCRGYKASHPLCADVYGVHGVVAVPMEHVDHIVPHRGDWALFWDAGNRQGLCASCHSRKTATEDGAFGRKSQ